MDRLAERLARGDQAAFAELYDRFVENIEAKLHLIPRYSQRNYRPRRSEI